MLFHTRINCQITPEIQWAVPYIKLHHLQVCPATICLYKRTFHKSPVRDIIQKITSQTQGRSFDLRSGRNKFYSFRHLHFPDKRTARITADRSILPGRRRIGLNISLNRHHFLIIANRFVPYDQGRPLPIYIHRLIQLIKNRNSHRSIFSIKIIDDTNTVIFLHKIIILVYSHNSFIGTQHRVIIGRTSV